MIPTIPIITTRIAEPLDVTAYRTTAEWNAALAAKYGDDWRDEPTERDLELEQSNG